MILNGVNVADPDGVREMCRIWAFGNRFCGNPVAQDMDDKTRTALKIVGVGTAAGLIGQGLFAQTGVGINALILTLAVVALAGIAFWKPVVGIDRRRLALYGVLICVFAGMLAWRDSTTLLILNFAALFALVGLCAVRPSDPSGEVQSVGTFVIRSCAQWILLFIEAVLLTTDITWSALKLPAENTRAKAVLRGGLMALPVLIIFGALFASADPLFRRAVSIDAMFRMDFEEAAQRFIMFWVIGAVTVGLLRQLFIGSQNQENVLKINPKMTIEPKIGPIEFGMIFGSLALLFAAFLVFQVRYLFGGNDLVLATTGLTYAEYARRGFFELATVAGLSIPLLLGFSSIYRRETPRSIRIYQVISSVFIGLLIVVLGSAVYRMNLYVDIYGLTELRYGVEASMVAMAVLFAGLAVIIWMNQIKRVGQLMAFVIFGSIISLNVANPDSVIAAHNLARMGENKRIDHSYLAHLSSDAVPVILRSLDKMPQDVRDSLTASIKEKTENQKGDWRQWNVSRVVAQRASRKLRE